NYLLPPLPPLQEPRFVHHDPPSAGQHPSTSIALRDEASLNNEMDHTLPMYWNAFLPHSMPDAVRSVFAVHAEEEAFAQLQSPTPGASEADEDEQADDLRDRERDELIDRARDGLITRDHGEREDVEVAPPPGALRGRRGDELAGMQELPALERRNGAFSSRVAAGAAAAALAAQERHLHGIGNPEEPELSWYTSFNSVYPKTVKQFNQQMQTYSVLDRNLREILGTPGQGGEDYAERDQSSRKIERPLQLAIETACLDGNPASLEVVRLLLSQGTERQIYSAGSGSEAEPKVAAAAAKDPRAKYAAFAQKLVESERIDLWPPEDDHVNMIPSEKRSAPQEDGISSSPSAGKQAALFPPFITWKKFLRNHRSATSRVKNLLLRTVEVCLGNRYALWRVMHKQKFPSAQLA
ncbi:unnamed protein product, partial [Amoebophrya sp. A25]